jgi:hypothetical protein
MNLSESPDDHTEDRMNTKTQTAKAIPAISCETQTAWVSGLADNSVAVQLTFADGDGIYLQASELTEDIQRMALAHGLKQKLVDAAAISRNPETGKPATIADKKAAVVEVYERLLAGEWNKRREGGETGGLLLRALLRMYDGRKTRDELVAYLAGKTDEEKTALRANPKVAAIIAKIKAEKADESIDTDALLGELED